MDRYFVDTDNDFYAVMDGTSAGGEFSDLFVTWLLEMVEKLRNNLEDSPRSAEKISEFFAQFIEEANESIHERMAQYYGGRYFSQALGAGSTLVLAHRVDEQWVVASSGDSIALLVRGDSLLQFTPKDTLFNEWIRNGIVTLNETGDPIFQKTEKNGEECWKFEGGETNFRGLMSALKRMERWVGNEALPNLAIEPAQSGDVLVLLTDGAERLVSPKDKDKFLKAVAAVTSGEVEHLLAATGFWEHYQLDKRLYDDATALVVYEG